MDQFSDYARLRSGPTSSALTLRISRGALGTVDRVEIGGERFALKRFSRRACRSWALEVASHQTCPQPDVAPLIDYGIDPAGRGWLLTAWIDADNVRNHVRRGNPAIKVAADNWIAGFQQRLAECGYRWVDATPRNVLVRGIGGDLDQLIFAAVDYTVRPIGDSRALDECVKDLLLPGSAEWRSCDSGRNPFAFTPSLD